MPPKKGGSRKPKVKLTEEQIRANFEAFQNGPIMKELVRLGDIQNIYRISEEVKDANNDMCVRIQPYLDELPKIAELMKIKNSKLAKPIPQEVMRVAFFCGYPGRNDPFKIDGIGYKFEINDISVDGSATKTPFTAFNTLIKGVKEWGINEYEQKLKDVSLEYSSMVRSFKKFTKGQKKAFALGKSYMVKMLEPLQDLLNCNMGLTLVDFEYPNDIQYEVNNYRYLALITQFCEFYMRVQKIMHDNPEIDSNQVRVKELKGNPDIYSILKKFQYHGWRENNVERFYIQPLLNAFLKLRSNMAKLYLLGFNYWRLPLIQNDQLKRDMEEMQEAEAIAEPIMGNRLQREQLNFLYDQIDIIFKSPGWKKLFDVGKEKNKMILYSIPQLVVLKSIERMHSIFNVKLKEQTEPEPYHRLEIEPPKPLIEFALFNSFDKKVRTWQDLLPPGMVYSETLEIANLGPVTVNIDDNKISELDKYGRFMVWFDFIPEDQHNVMIEAMKILRTINRAALQDLEDFIIAQGMQATRRDYKSQPDAAAANKGILEMEEEEKKADVFKNRPPNVWNEPESLLMEHNFKYSANPLEIYQDKRVHDLYNKLGDMALKISSFKAKEWNNLVERVIEVFRVDPENIKRNNN